MVSSFVLDQENNNIKDKHNTYEGNSHNLICDNIIESSIVGTLKLGVIESESISGCRVGGTIFRNHCATWEVNLYF